MRYKMIIDTYNWITLFIELFSINALLFVECFRKYPKLTYKRGLRVLQTVDSLKYRGKTDENPRLSTAIVNLIPKNHDGGVWLLFVSSFTLNKYPCKTSFLFNLGLTFLHPVTTIPK